MGVPGPSLNFSFFTCETAVVPLYGLRLLIASVRNMTQIDYSIKGNFVSSCNGNPGIRLTLGICIEVLSSCGESVSVPLDFLIFR